MPLFFDTVQRASWAGFEFPVREIQILGAARLKEHEYAHQDGANLEPLGRKAYRIRMRMQFDEGDTVYPGIYPTRLNDIRFIAESGTSADLVIPNVGTIKAFCPRWVQTWTAMIRSGEHADYEFIEDQSATLKQVFFTATSSAASMQQRASDLASYRNLAAAQGVDPSLIDQVISAANDILAIRDTANLTAQLAETRIESMVNALGVLDTALTSPVSYEVIEAERQLWASLFDFENDVSNVIAPPSTWLVPSLMALSDVSRNIYGDTEHQTDILVWNAIPDAFAIPAGTEIRFVPLAA